MQYFIALLRSVIDTALVNRKNIKILFKITTISLTLYLILIITLIIQKYTIHICLKNNQTYIYYISRSKIPWTGNDMVIGWRDWEQFLLRIYLLWWRKLMNCAVLWCWISWTTNGCAITNITKRCRHKTFRPHVLSGGHSLW